MTEKFHHQTPHGEIVMPRMGQLPLGAVRKIRKLTDADGLFTLLEDIAADQLPVIDQLTVEEFNAFAEAWRADSGVGVGESSAS
jgi:hypothetical protein